MTIPDDLQARLARIEHDLMARYYADGATATWRRAFVRIAELEQALEDRACDYELLEIAAHNFRAVATFPTWSAGDCRLCRYTQEGHAADCPYALADAALRAALAKEELSDAH